MRRIFFLLSLSCTSLLFAELSVGKNTVSQNSNVKGINSETICSEDTNFKASVKYVFAQPLDDGTHSLSVYATKPLTSKNTINKLRLNPFDTSICRETPADQKYTLLVANEDFDGADGKPNIAFEFSPTELGSALGNEFCNEDKNATFALCLYDATSESGKMKLLYGFPVSTSVSQAGSDAASTGAKAVMISGITATAAEGAVYIEVDATGDIGPTAPFCLYKTSLTETLGLEAFNKEKGCTSGSLIASAERISENYFKISGLENDQTYFIKLTQGENTLAAAREFTPQEELSALQLYNGPSNPTSLNCSSTNSPSTALLLLILGVFYFLVRTNSKKSNITAPLLVTTLFLTALPLSATKPGTFNFSINGSPYIPNIDATLKADGNAIAPMYRCGFSNDPDSDPNGPTLALMGADFDYHVSNAFGSVLIGLSSKLTWVNGHATFKAGDDETCGKQSGTPTKAYFFQLKPQVTYIFDPYIDSFPVAPYVRAAIVGAGYAFMYDGALDKRSSTFNPIGMVFGYEAAIGLLLGLDFLEPQGAIRSRATSGYNRSYLKAELAYQRVDNFHQPVMDLSPKDIMGTGLPLIWTFGLVVEFQ